MFVTSDVHDLAFLAGIEGRVWREQLIAGVAFHGPTWPGFHRAANYLLGASRETGTSDWMERGGYNPPRSFKSRDIKVQTFIEYATSRDEERELRMNSALLSGNPAIAGGGKIFVGGGLTRGMTGKAEPRADFKGSFVYPLNADSVRIARSLLRAASELTDARYGYFFVRDEYALPRGYAHGLNATLAYREDKSGDQNEITQWSRFYKRGYWSDAHPKLRDLFAVNLLSARHLGRRLGAGTLADWIEADPTHGELENIGGERWLWTLIDAQMESARPLMMEAGIVTARCRRVWRGGE